MSKVLAHFAVRAAGWSMAADQRKSQQERARWVVFGLSIAGALLAAIASQIPADDAHAALRAAHKHIAAFAALLLAVATVITQRFLSAEKTQAWVRAREASESLKREAFKFAARATPYDDTDLSSVETLFRTECDKIQLAAEQVAQPVDNPSRPGSAPREILTPDDYRTKRVKAQADGFYRVKAQQYRITAKRLKVAEFTFALTATLVTAYAGAMGAPIVISGIAFDLAALTAVLTTVSGAILTHIAASRLDHLVDTYSATARRLDSQDLDFERARLDPASWSRYVVACEDIIAAENSSWVAKWASEKA